MIAHPEQVNGNYRSLPLQHLRERGHFVHVETGSLSFGELADFDVAHIYRFANRELRGLVRQLREHGVAIVWDNDDDMASGDDRRRGALRSQSEVAGVREMLSLAHVVTTPSQLLAETYRAGGAREALVVDNFLPAWFSHRPETAAGEVRVGWVASKEHRDDLEALGIADLLAAALERHPALHVESVGIHLKLRSDRYRNTMHLPFDRLPARLARFDIGIAPLADTPFNRARSTVKLKEYASCGAAWLASATGPYRDLGATEGGLLVPDDGWADALDRLIADRRERQKLAASGNKWAQSQMANREANVTSWEHAIVRAHELAGAAVAA
ncbi:glycosyltransferase [Conexibacter sp. JD483]|uniref:glycosyltransferase family protein n=1 Tax=unclassified Conexibacter TaxID=2627773 RepID=UPI00271D3B4C|nr:MULTISPECIES: glycosyltransferase [unclassified Conexibacter]MDO8184213.1 glycosyltransferase [Conexibacter sp. CPCC 205706]MDO8197205.1 glycosyltransferase [Conexibacter sp. CPCC 205762]MDR9367480.1 glycosyltransferase [Conexibacter sp. JD483]